MQLDDIRFLFGFDRWATTKILDARETAAGHSPGDLDMIDFAESTTGDTT